MKTINDAAIDYLYKITGNISGKLPQIFKAGAEFAQRWIPVEEELPVFGIRVLIKNEDGFEWFGHTNHRGCLNYEDKNTSCEPKITHWRPIDLK